VKALQETLGMYQLQGRSSPTFMAEVEQVKKADTAEKSFTVG